MSPPSTSQGESGRTCWASGLGGCAGGLSGEHLISENLFEGPRIMVSGFPWLLGQTREIGLAALTANILCRAHNSALSPVDIAGGDAFRLLRKIAARWREDLAVASNRRRSAVEYEIDGVMLERWFAKCSVNISRVVGRAQAVPLSLTRFIFGIGELPAPRGLYGAQIRNAINLWPVVKFAPLLSSDDVLIAMLFGLHNLRFALWLYEEPPDLSLIEQGPDWQVTSLLRHPVAMDFRVERVVTRRLRFRWS